MQKKNKSNLFKKIICVFLLSLTFITSGSIVAYAVGNVEAGVYRLNALDETQYEELISTYSFSNIYFNINATFNFYDIDSNLIVSNTEYDPEACRSGFGIDSTSGTLSSYFVWQDLGEVSWHYFAGNKTNSTLIVIENWYYIELLEDITTFSTTVLDKFFTGSTATPLLVKTQLGYDKPGDVPQEYEIPSGTYKLNYNFYWPLETEVEFTGGFTFLGGVWEYSRLRISSDSIIAYYVEGTNSDTKTLYENGVWLVDDPTFTTTGLNPDSTHNASSSFLSQVNGNGYGDTGLVLEDQTYKFKKNISYPTSFTQSNISFKTGEDNGLTFTRIYFSSDLELEYGDDVVYSNNTWINQDYKNFYMPGIVESYKLGSFLSRNLDFTSIDKTFLLKGYYYFNSSIEGSDLKLASDINKVVFICNGNIYNTMTYKNIGIEPNPLLYFKTTFTFSNSSTIGTEQLINYTYYSAVNNPLATEYPTNPNARQIFISPIYVDQETYDWYLRNGEFIYYQENVADFPTLIGVFPDVIVNFMANLMSFDVFGVNLFTAISSLITVLVAVWIIRKII